MTKKRQVKGRERDGEKKGDGSLEELSPACRERAGCLYTPGALAASPGRPHVCPALRAVVRAVLLRGGSEASGKGREVSCPAQVRSDSPEGAEIGHRVGMQAAPRHLCRDSQARVTPAWGPSRLLHASGSQNGHTQRRTPFFCVACAQGSCFYCPVVPPELPHGFEDHQDLAMEPADSGLSPHGAVSDLSHCEKREGGRPHFHRGMVHEGLKKCELVVNI